MNRLYTSFVCLLLALSLNAQESTLGDLYFRNIGPANAGGRVVDIEAHPDDFTKVYVASASGGVWKSVNAGTTWEPIFDDYETASIGDIAIDPSDTQIIWVGTGEANNRNSVSWGNGIYKSIDGGASFESKGLEETHQISRVLVNPNESDEVCVCAIGHLWGTTGDRGLFKTKDGGATWQKKTKGLPNDGKTGCTDLVRDSQNPDILYAAFYERLREPWHFNSGGENGGIYKSTDGGESWSELTNGLPVGPTGRIGLAIYEKDPNILMALVEAEKTDTLSIPGSGLYRSEDGGASWIYVNTYNNRPFYYSQVRINPHDDQKVYLLTTRFMVSEDGGQTLHNGSEDQEVHGDFHAMWLDPSDPNRYYLGADKGLSMTHDHGASFRLIDNLPIAQFYRINYDMQTPYYVYGGLQDNGSYAVASFSRDARGILSDDNWKMHWGDGQDAAFNPYDHTDGYSSSENGSFTKYNPETREIYSIKPMSSNTSNYMDYIDIADADVKSQMRFNWSAPLVMSPHHPSTIYVAGNYVYKSTNKGKTWKIISPDLTTNDPVKRKFGVSGGITMDNSGAETHCAVYSLSVSPIDEHIIWVGTDDGLVQVTKDGGMHWQNVRTTIPAVPQGIWVSRVEASHFIPGRAYVTFDGHRSDHFGTWVFVTEDYGKSWRQITDGITSHEVVRVIREDHINPNLLFIGTETGVWISENRGNSWSRMTGLPTVSVYDLKIHTRDNDLIVGTHGRGIWIMDDISPLQHIGTDQAAIVVPPQRSTVLWNNISRGGQRGHFWWAGDNPKYIDNTSSIPRANYDIMATVSFIIDDSSIDSVSIEIQDAHNGYMFSDRIAVQQGINRYYWDRTFDATPLSSEDDQAIIKAFEDIMRHNDSRYINRAYARYKSAGTDQQKRQTIDFLTRSAQMVPFPEKYGLVRAAEGAYMVSIFAGNSAEHGSIEILSDPLSK